MAVGALGLALGLLGTLGLPARGADEIKAAGEPQTSGGAAAPNGPAAPAATTAPAATATPGEAKAPGDAKAALEAKQAEEAAKNAQTFVSDPIEAALDHLRQMPLPMQQVWLKRLEARALRAARIRFDADEVKRQEAVVHAQLHQKMITWRVLHTVIDQVDSWERGVIDQLVRQYGNLVFDTFHKQIDVYNQRRQAWVDVYSDWEHAGKPFDQRERLIEWLQAAIRSAAPGSKEPIPERPKFVSEQPAAPVAPALPTQPPAVAKPQGAPGGAQAPPATAMPTPPTETAKPAAPAGTESPQKESPQKAKQEGDKPMPKAAANQPAEPAKPPATPGAGGAPPQAKPESGKPPEKAPAKQPTETPKPQAAVVPGTPPKSPALYPAAVETMTSVGRETPAAVEVEPEELAARIRGCNLALRALEVELDEKVAWTAERLEPLVKRLETLALRHHDLQLFREVVPQQERSGLETLASTRSAVSSLAVHIVAARNGASGAAFQGSEKDRQRELRRLTELSHRLAAAAEK
jgi:hypothetical protein